MQNGILIKGIDYINRKGAKMKTGVTSMRCLLVFLTALLPLTTNAQTGAGSALQFDGTSNYVDITNGVVLGTSFTQEAWVYAVPSTAYRGVLGSIPGAPEYRSPSFWIYNGTGLHGGFGDGSAWRNWTTPTGLLQLNAWNHIAVTYDGSIYRIYVNGNQVFTYSLSAVPVAQPMRSIGRVDNLFNGVIDEVRIWNVVRTQAQIQYGRTNSLTTPQAGLVAYYRLDEGTGNFTADLSGNGAHGTLVNGPIWITSTAPITAIPTSTPTVETQSAIDVGPSSATLKGRVDPHGLSTFAWFEYGATTNYGFSTTPVNVGSGTGFTPVSTGISGLHAYPYQYRLVATNTAGRMNGMNMSFSAISVDSVFLPAGSAVQNPDIAPADYDLDGKLDVLITGWPYAGGLYFTRIYRNEGNGVFSEQNPGLPQLDRGRIAWGDYNNDNYPDILMSGGSSNGIVTAICRNNGNGTFTALTNTGILPVRGGGVAWGDFDNDGRSDILLTGTTNLTDVWLGSGLFSRIYRNNGDGTFTDINAGLSDLDGGAVAWGDYNRDGFQDAIISGFDTNSVATTILYRNNGNGTFTATTNAFANAVMGRISWGDYNNDGWPDLLISGGDVSGFNRATHVYRNNGDGTFTDINAGLPGVPFAAWGDYDSDGRLDIFYTGSPSALSSAGISGLYLNAGGDTFINAQVMLPETGESAGAWGDFNNDGRLDFILSGAGFGYYARICWNNFAISNTPPAAPTGLSYFASGTNGVTFQWNPSSDNQTGSNGLSYNLRITWNGENPVSPLSDTNGFRRVVNLGNVGTATNYTVYGISNSIFSWGVQAIDSSFAGSAFATNYFLGYPPKLTNFARLPGGSTQFRLSGSASPLIGYSAEVSTNLSTWLPMAAPIQIGPGLFQFNDPSTNPTPRFYRGKASPL